MNTTTFDFSNNVDTNSQSLLTVLTIPLEGFQTNKLLKKVENQLEVLLEENNVETRLTRDEIDKIRELDKKGFAGQAIDNVKKAIASKYTIWLMSVLSDMAENKGLKLDENPDYGAFIASPSEFRDLRDATITLHLDKNYLPSIDEIDAVLEGFKTDLLILSEARFQDIKNFFDDVEPNILIGQDTKSPHYANEHYASLVFELLCYRLLEVDDVDDLSDLFSDVWEADCLDAHLYDEFNVNSKLVYEAIGNNEY